MSKSMMGKILVGVVVATLAIGVATPTASADPLLYMRLLGSTDGGTTYSDTLTVTAGQTIDYLVEVKIAGVGTSNTDLYGTTNTITSLVRGTAYWKTAVPKKWVYTSKGDGFNSARFNIEQSAATPIQVELYDESITNPAWLDLMADESQYAYPWGYNFGAGVGASWGTATARGGTGYKNLLGVAAVLPVDQNFVGLDASNNPEWFAVAYGQMVVKAAPGGSSSTVNLTPLTGSGESAGAIRFNNGAGSAVLEWSKNNPDDPFVNYASLTLQTTGGAATPAIALSSPVSATIITGGTGTLGVTVGNSGDAGSTLAYTASAVVTGGSATLGSVSPGSGSILQGDPAQANTVSASSTNIGFEANTIQFTVSATGASNTPQTQNVKLTVYDHASGSASGTTIALPDLIVGYSGPVAGLSSASVSNATGFRVDLKTTGTTSSGNVSINNVSGLTAGGAAGTISASLAAGQGVGVINTLFSLTYADDSALNGASSNLGTLGITVTGNVYDHASGSASGTTITLPGVIVGYSDPVAGLSSASVSNAAGLRVDLKTTGTTSSGNVSINNVSGLTAGGAAGTISASLAVGQGLGSISEVFSLTYADDSVLSGASSNLGTLGITVTGTVYDHALPSLSLASVNIGDKLRNASVVVSTDLHNDDHPAPNQRVSLQIMDLGGMTGASVGDKIAANGFATLSGVVNTSGLGAVNQEFVVQVADDQLYAGKGATSLANQTLTVTGNVGEAQADSVEVFGTPLTASVAVAGSLANLESTVVGPPGDPANLVASTATLLAGTNDSTGVIEVGMAWRRRNPDEEKLTGWHLVSDVMQLTGIPAGNLYALRMDYDPELEAIKGNEAALALAGLIHLVTWDTVGEAWVNAVLLNTGNNATSEQQNYQGSFAAFQVAYGTSLSSYVGAWGVDTGNDEVWAVLNHASDFAVVPEPATLAFLAFGGLAMAGAGLTRRRRSRKA